MGQGVGVRPQHLMAINCRPLLHRIAQTALAKRWGGRNPPTEALRLVTFLGEPFQLISQASLGSMGIVSFPHHETRLELAGIAHLRSGAADCC
jgi:hypothetical protein